MARCKSSTPYQDPQLERSHCAGRRVAEPAADGEEVTEKCAICWKKLSRLEAVSACSTHGCEEPICAKCDRLYSHCTRHSASPPECVAQHCYYHQTRR